MIYIQPQCVMKLIEVSLCYYKIPLMQREHDIKEVTLHCFFYIHTYKITK